MTSEMKCMAGHCPCKQIATRRLPLSEKALRASLKVLCIDGFHYKDEINEFCDRFANHKSSKYRVADGHFEPGLLKPGKKLAAEMQVPTRRFVPDEVGGGMYQDCKAARLAATPSKPPPTPSMASIGRLLQHPTPRSASQHAKVLSSRSHAKLDRIAVLEADLEQQRKRIAELEDLARFPWKSHMGGHSPCYRWESVRSSPPEVIHALTGFHSSQCFTALHDLLNSCHMLSDIKVATTESLRAAVTANVRADSTTHVGEPERAGDSAATATATAGAAAGSATRAAGVAASAAAGSATRAAGVAAGAAAGSATRAAGVAAGASPTPSAGKRQREPVSKVLFVDDRSTRPGGRSRLLSTYDLLFMVMFILSTGCTFSLTAWCFAISAATVSQTFCAVIRAMDLFLQKEFPPIAYARATLLTPAHIGKRLGGADMATYVADGTEFKQMKPSALDVQRDVSYC